mgnify:CR=1 FL=1
MPDTASASVAVPCRMMSGNPAVAAGRQPDRRNSRNSPLASVAVSAQNQIGMMLRFQLIENVRRMREQQLFAAARAQQTAPHALPAR